MPIKQIVMAGGGYLGFYHLGAISRLLNVGYLKRNNIHTIYGTSIGAFFGAVFCLNEDWNTTLDYFIERPWHKVFNLTPNKVFQAIPKKGMYGQDTFNELLLPLIKSRHYSDTMTLVELYNLSNITLYMYTIDLNTFTLEEISHHTHPDLKLLDALYMTCSLPFLFQPLIQNDKCYVDGGLLNSYPLENCLQRTTDTSEVLGLRFDVTKHVKEITDKENIFEYGYFLYRSLIQNVRNTDYPEIEHEIIIPCMQMNMSDGSKAVQSSEERRNYIKTGQQLADRYLATITRL